MLDMALVRENPDRYRSLVLKKDPDYDFDLLLSLDSELRKVRLELESLREEKNKVAKLGASGITDEVRAKGIELGRRIKSLEEQFAALEKRFLEHASSCPNSPFDDVPVGGKESNKVVKVVGEVPDFDFEPKSHVELNESVGWFDLKSGARLSGSGFVVYKGDGLRLLYALLLKMLKHNVEHGYQPYLPPYLVKEEVLYNSGNLPKFKGDFYEVPADSLSLIPTAEVSLTTMVAGKIFDESELPLRMTAWTSCFRREAGGYGASERGLIRIHQFEKVEIYSVCRPEDSASELDRIVSVAEKLLSFIGIPYRISLLAAQDCSFASAKTYDIEVWMPSLKRYIEVSSCSNCTDFQARRAKIKFKRELESGKKVKSYVHTLNGSSLALPRVMAAIMENFQTRDGAVNVPEHLLSLMDNFLKF